MASVSKAPKKLPASFLGACLTFTRMAEVKLVLFARWVVALKNARHVVERSVFDLFSYGRIRVSGAVPSRNHRGSAPREIQNE